MKYRLHDDEEYILCSNHILFLDENSKPSKPSNSEATAWYYSYQFFFRENGYATQLDTTPSRNSPGSTMNQRCGIEPLYQTRSCVRTYRIQHDWMLIPSRLRSASTNTQTTVLCISLCNPESLSLSNPAEIDNICILYNIYVYIKHNISIEQLNLWIKCDKKTFRLKNIKF